MNWRRLLLNGLIILGLVAILFRLVMALLVVNGRVTSWWRTPWHNAKVRGHPLSRHQIGLAVDVAPPNAADHERLRRFVALVPTATLVNEGDHLHVQLV